MDSLSEKFYAGLYTDIVAVYIDAARPLAFDAGQAVWVCGALCFLGRASESEAIYSAHAPAMSLRQSAEARLYLVMANRRQRRKAASAHARLVLMGLIRDIRAQSKASDDVAFFAACALAFYRYVDARFPVALRWARRAYDHAFRAKFPFGRLLAYDLVGHCQMNIGDVRAGMKNLQNSASLAEGLGRGAIKQATDVTLRLYRSTFGLDHAKILLEDIRGAIRSCSFENSYTLASLYLEQARLQLLAGEGHEAQQSLRDAGEWVYRLDVPFLDANLTFRYAYLAYVQGSYQKALELLRSAFRRVEDAQDASMEARILGLEVSVLRRLGLQSDAARLVPQVRRLEKRSGMLLAQRINSRLLLSEPLVGKRGEDPLGDLIDDLSDNTLDVRERLLSQGFLGLIPKVLDIPLSSSAIVFGFVRDSVTLLASGHIRHDPDGWPDLVRKLFFALADHRQISKEEIVTLVWRQSYNPLRHDPLIYALIARARKVLEPYEGWLTVGEGSYRLDAGILVRDVTITSPEKVPERVVENQVAQRYPDLSVRHSRIMNLCEQRGAVSNKDVCEAFSVSEVTAGRDLADLVDRGYLRRVGKGRATSYTLA